MVPVTTPEEMNVPTYEVELLSQRRVTVTVEADDEDEARAEAQEFDNNGAEWSESDVDVYEVQSVEEVEQ